MDARTEPLHLAGGSFDPLRGELRLEGRCERLRPRSAAVLAVLLEERGRVVSRDELMRRVWPDAVVTDDSLAQCIKEIRRALGPAAERIRTLPRVGYAFADPAPEQMAQDGVKPPPAAEPATAALPVSAPEAVAAIPGPAPAADAGEPGARPLRGARLRRLLAGCALALLALVVLGPSVLSQPREAPRFSMVVLPLAGTGADAAPDGFAEAVADDLTTALTRIPGAFVVARGTADSYRGQAVDARRVGHELGVRYLVEGSVRRAEAQMALTLRLVDAQSREVLWSERFESAGDGGALRRMVPARVVRELQLAMMENEAVRAGRHRAMRPEEALEMARAQLREYPQHAPAWLWAATAQLRLGDAGAAASAAEQSIRLAPPDDADAALRWSVLSRARLLAGDARGALAAAEQAARSPGPNRYAPLLIAAAAMQLGDTQRARRVMVEFLARNPGFSVEVLKAKSGNLKDWNSGGEESYVAALVGAGLPAR